MFMNNATQSSGIVPKDFAETMEYEEFGSAPETAVGTGPYRVVEWARHDRLVLEAFEDYWQGPASIQEVIFRPIPDSSARVPALRAGEIHIAEQLPIEQMEELEGSVAETRSVLGNQRQRLILNTNREPFDSVEVRQAVHYALNVPDITEHVLLGLGEQIP
jgi:peptide/nickel transport system substrate-binding protein